jgi:hypothetical protein
MMRFVFDVKLTRDVLIIDLNRPIHRRRLLPR